MENIPNNINKQPVGKGEENNKLAVGQIPGSPDGSEGVITTPTDPNPDRDFGTTQENPDALGTSGEDNIFGGYERFPSDETDTNSGYSRFTEYGDGGGVDHNYSDRDNGGI